MCKRAYKHEFTIVGGSGQNQLVRQTWTLAQKKTPGVQQRCVAGGAAYIRTSKMPLVTLTLSSSSRSSGFDSSLYTMRFGQISAQELYPRRVPNAQTMTLRGASSASNCRLQCERVRMKCE
ncbi:hypothetical protein JOB18_003185 [Solea senegalensis]|uniref:Uncharacterized protein n=1 Tax=Solea senegalensis TaxID=28829 RepID=A0AAV6S0X8_SOLSE|nr:hypothetical protein JOB18_003185 [Solea senegalensis]